MEKVFRCSNKEQRRNIQQKLLRWEKSSDYTTGNLLGYDYFSNNYKLCTIDLI